MIIELLSCITQQPPSPSSQGCSGSLCPLAGSILGVAPTQVQHQHLAFLNVMTFPWATSRHFPSPPWMTLSFRGVMALWAWCHLRICWGCPWSLCLCHWWIYWIALAPAQTPDGHTDIFISMLYLLTSYKPHTSRSPSFCPSIHPSIPRHLSYLWVQHSNHPFRTRQTLKEVSPIPLQGTHVFLSLSNLFWIPLNFVKKSWRLILYWVKTTL